MKYGLTCDNYDLLVARANGHCELCQTAESRTTRGALVIDHFAGGDLFFVRGLICDRCNSVMSRHDRRATWGPSSLPWADKARRYHLAAFEQPTPEEFKQAEQIIASRKPYAVKDRILTPVKGPKTYYVRLDRSLEEIASKLRHHLTAGERTELAELLAKASTPPR
ncbi:endonuclease domain-containing protein [Streptomyces sp. NPDC102406]|uniref:endonuclease domain-containing protein n=1 Tax=Streptomyces sp. NPDC102406 TaxID=3366171 RepID=UPI003807F7BE